MTIGTKIVGSTSPSESGIYKAWSGGDSFPDRSKWNPYSVTAFTRRISYSRYPMGVGMPFVLPFTSDDDLRLLDKLSQEVRQHDFNAGVFLGQAGEVAKSVAGTASAFKCIATSLKRGNLDGALRCLTRSVGGSDIKAAKKRLDTGDIAGAHLSLVYGWLPLLSDVHAASEALEVLANPPRRSSVTVRRTRIVEVDGAQSPTLYSCIGPMSHGKVIQYRMTEELSQARSLGLLDPISVAWELVPYSFVVDWFVPIGTYLANLAVIPFLRGEFLITERRKWAASCIVKPKYKYLYDGSSFSREMVLSRSVASSLQVPLPTFRGFASLYKSSQRTANAIALMRNLYRK